MTGEPIAPTGRTDFPTLPQLQQRLESGGLDVTAEELCEALWLFAQAERWGGLPAVPFARLPSGAAKANPAGPEAGGRGSTARPARDGWGQPGGPDDPGGASGSWPDGAGVRYVITGEEGAADDGPAFPVAVRVPDAPALPEARRLLRALRRFRYDQGRVYEWDQRHPATDGSPGRINYAAGPHCTPDAIDEEGTAQLIAQTDLRLPVLRTTRRRRFDLDLVLDTGGSGLIWARLAMELRAVLQASGAFRIVRPWTLDTESPEMLPRPAEVLTGHSGRLAYRWEVTGHRSRRPLVMVLTDGAGRGWRSGEAGEALRAWTARKDVVLAQLLPPEMWDRTGLRALAVTFRPDGNGYHRAARLGISDASLLQAGVDRAELRDSVAVPVIALDEGGLVSWLPLLHRVENAEVPGRALLIPPEPGRRAPRDPAGHEEAAGAGDLVRLGDFARLGDDDPLTDGLDGRERVERFMLSASADARRLARLLGVIDQLTLPIIRKVRHELLPQSRPYVLAEVLLGGLLHWAPTTATASLAGRTLFYWHADVKEVLQERPGGLTQFRWDQELVRDALAPGPGPYGSAELTAVVPYEAGTRAGGPAHLSAPSGGRARTADRPSLVLRPLRVPAPGRLRESRFGLVSALEPIDDADVSVDPPATSPSSPLQIGVWGSTASGRTVYLTALCKLGQAERWTPWKGELWRVIPDNDGTKGYVEAIRAELEDTRTFPAGTLPGHGQQLSFRIERRRPRGRGALRWFLPERTASITMRLEDWGGGSFDYETQAVPAASYLVESDVLLYFFDPLYDDGKHRSLDYFDATVLELSRAAIEEDRLYEGRLPQHIAVCMPKLDDQWVFNIARSAGCLDIDPVTSLPWVPPGAARRLFGEITIEKGTFDADYLRREIGVAFHPRRTSYHAFTSIGFWTEDGRLNVRNVCKVEPLSAEEQQAYVRNPGSPPRRRLRGTGELTPVHVLDPIIALVERASRQGGGR